MRDADDSHSGIGETVVSGAAAHACAFNRVEWLQVTSGPTDSYRRLAASCSAVLHVHAMQEVSRDSMLKTRMCAGVPLLCSGDKSCLVSRLSMLKPDPYLCMCARRCSAQAMKVEIDFEKGKNAAGVFVHK